MRNQSAMPSALVIRNETAADVSAITEVTVAAFRTLAISNHTEQLSGFKPVPGLIHEGVPQEVFLALSLDGQTPQDTVTFHEGFKAVGPQEGAGDAVRRA
jgi:hypothetical protein